MRKLNERLKKWLKQVTCRHNDGRIAQYNNTKCPTCGKTWTH